jgi:hypothetical protein
VGCGPGASLGVPPGMAVDILWIRQPEIPRARNA